MLSSTFNRAAFAAARNYGGKKMPRCLSTVQIDSKQGFSSSSKENETVDPMEVFDSIDTNGDGVLSKEEFKMAVEKMHFVSMTQLCRVLY
jgi:Ca2+-binding EF-hand superfamily protein